MIIAVCYVVFIFRGGDYVFVNLILNSVCSFYNCYNVDIFLYIRD
jgi:hypothetical protein